MSTAHDIYDPPPAPVPLAPTPERIAWTTGDLVVLISLVVVAIALAIWAWTVEPSLAVLVLIGAAIVIVESWSTALGFLHRHRRLAGRGGRWTIFAAALVPWLLGIALATALMMGLFLLLDRFS
ncbi:MAG TPA: hypothetical protein VGH33_26860 [Isosphaeraceae bacterium]|jgi:hypothetical protein